MLAIVAPFYGPCPKDSYSVNIANAFYSMATIRELPCDTVVAYKWYDLLRTIVPGFIFYVLLETTIVKIGQGFFSLFEFLTTE